MRYFNYKDSAQDMRLTMVHFDLACAVQTGSLPAGVTMADFNTIVEVLNTLHVKETAVACISSSVAEYYRSKLFSVKLDDNGVNYIISLNNKYRLYILDYEYAGKPAYCVSYDSTEGYTDDDIWTHLGISEYAFNNAGRRAGAEYYHHNFWYGENDCKLVCDSYFDSRAGAEDFIAHLLDSIIKENR